MWEKIKGERKSFVSRADLGQIPTTKNIFFSCSINREINPDEYEEILGEDGYIRVVHTPKQLCGG